MNFLEKFSEYTKYVEAPKSFKIWSAISIVAAALERKVWTEFDGTCYPNLYMMFVAPPGTGKSLSSNYAYRLINRVEGIEYASTSVTSAAFVSSLCSTGVRKLFEWDGTNYNHTAVYMYSSEAVSTLKNHEGNLIWLLNDFYDSGPIHGWSNDVSWKKSTVGRGDEKLFNICVNLLGCCTPDLLASTIVEQNFKSGFGSRCLFIVDYTPRVVIPWREKKNTKHLEQELVDDLKRIHEMKGCFTVTDAYRDQYDTFRQEYVNQALSHAEDFLGGYYSRKAWNMRKLSMVLAACQGDEMKLDVSTLLAAESLFSELEKSLQGAFGHADKSNETKMLVEIWDILRKIPSNVLSRQQVSKKLLAYEREVTYKTLRRLSELEKIAINAGPPVSYRIIDREPIV